MKHLQTYRLFESTQTLTKEQEAFLDKFTTGTWSLNPSTGKVDIDGNFFVYRNQDLKDFIGISFGSVSGDFSFSGNSFQTLERAPEAVGGDFSCSNNYLKTLEGAPKTVGGNFYCRNNYLKTLEGAPRTVGGNFSCDDNSLQSLEGAPRIVGGSFDCSHNYLQTLEGAPETVGGFFDCDDNSLQTLGGAPETIAGEFYSDDIKITEGKWSQETLIKIFTTGTPREKQLVAPLVDPKTIQKMIDQDPEKMLVKLKDHLKDPHFKDLKWPERLEREKGLLSDLSDVGL